MDANTKRIVENSWHERVLARSVSLNRELQEVAEMGEIARGDRVRAKAADGTVRDLRALGDIIAGGDFAVVWACSEREWNAALAEGREPQGIPWPADDVTFVAPVAASGR